MGPDSEKPVGTALAAQFAPNELVHGLPIYTPTGQLWHDDLHDTPEILGRGGAGFADRGLDEPFDLSRIGRRR